MFGVMSPQRCPWQEGTGARQPLHTGDPAPVTLGVDIASTQGLPWDEGPWSSKTVDPTSGSSHFSLSLRTGTCLSGGPYMAVLGEVIEMQGEEEGVGRPVCTVEGPG